MKIELLISTGAIVFGAVLIFRRVRNAQTTPDPWPREVEESIQETDAVPVCHRCFTPQTHDAWFCPECGTSVGKYNNCMPYLNVFSQGEVLRAGVSDRIRPGLLTSLGYLLLSLNYYFFAPVYWFFLSKNFRNARRAEDAESV